MSESDTSEENEQNETATIDFSDLSDEQKEALSAHPEVRKMLTYEETSIPQISGMLKNLQEADENADDENEAEKAEAFNLLVSGIAERSGRVTESTVEKVLAGFVEEYDSVKWGLSKSFQHSS